MQLFQVGWHQRFHLALSQVGRPQKIRLTFWLHFCFLYTAKIFSVEKYLLFHFFGNTFAKFL